LDCKTRYQALIINLYFEFPLLCIQNLNKKPETAKGLINETIQTKTTVCLVLASTTRTLANTNENIDKMYLLVYYDDLY